MSNCVETSEDVWGLVTVSNTPLILRLSLAWPDDAFLTIFQVCFSPIVSCISHTLQWYISQMTPNRVCPSGTSASVSDLLCLMMCFYKQQYFSLTHEQYFSKRSLFKCPHIVSALLARLRLMMSTTTALRKGLCLVYDLWLCHCDRPKYHTRDIRWGARIHLSECEQMPMPMFDVEVVGGRRALWLTMSHPEPGMPMCSHQCEHV